MEENFKNDEVFSHFVVRTRPINYEMPPFYTVSNQ